MASWVSYVVRELARWVLREVPGWVGSAAVQKIVEGGIESYSSKRTMPGETEAAIKRIEAALPRIRAVMGVAEALKMKDPSCSGWVQQFREAVDAAEDVIDELEYKKLEEMVQNRDDQVGGSSSRSKKRKTCAISGDILERLKKAVTMLDEAIAGVDNLLQSAKILGIHYLSESQFEVRTNLNRERTSFLTVREVFGREAEKAQIIDWLTRETKAPLSCFGIVGVGGLGKTTLAQSVYQEMHRLGYFQKTIWVCVSTEFSVKGITTKILGELEGGSHGDNPLNKLQEMLQEKIASKKILLILDDIWEDGKKEDWEQLIAPLNAQHGSKILFTTRQNSVAELLASVIRTEYESLALKDLGEQELRSLFNSHAFNGFNPDEYGYLQSIGDQIVKKLHGSPLVAKVIGGLLNSQMDPTHWKRILDSDSLINLQEANHVMEGLKLSYYNLPADLQVCFRFCSIFPQDYEFNKKELIKMWMASGFIGQQSGQEDRLEDIGEHYFNDLLRKSFFEFRESLGQERYVMHDLMHELAQNVSKGECYRVASNDKSISIRSTVRHVSVHESEIHKVSHLENIRSLVITTSLPQDWNNLTFFVLPNNLLKKSLRLVKIDGYSRWRLPEEISCLVHLRYLSIQVLHTSFKFTVPASIYKLYHLLVLEIGGHPSLEPFWSLIETTGMANLVNLRHMRLPDHIIQTISGVHNMTSLQKLTFSIRQESGYRINELHTLNHLRHLTINNIENIRDPAEARSANLLAKKNLQSLSLICTLESNLDNPEQIFDNLQPYQNLMELKITNYKGQRFPTWFRDTSPSKMSYLKILHINGCPNLVQLPDMPLSLTEFLVQDVGLTSLPNLYQSFGGNTSTPFSLKSSLRIVEIINCPNLISLNRFLMQGTQDLHCLERLRIDKCEKLAQLPMHAFKTCVSLKDLSIRDCLNLTRLPCLPLSLISFKIHGIAISALPECYENPGSSCGPSPSSFTSSLKKVHIWNCPNLTVLNGFLLQGTLDLHCLEKLKIEDCEKLTQQPMHAFMTCVSLKYLSIIDCPNLTKLPCLPLSLISFAIHEIAISALPECYKNPGSSCGPSPSLFTSSLREVDISNCPNLISLNGFLLQGTLDLHYLEKLEIEKCEKLAQQPMHAFMTCVSLKYLSIGDCPNLTRLPCLPLSLISFAIHGIAISALPEYYKNPGSSCGPSPSSFTSSLRIVHIWDCPNLTALNGFLQQDNIDFCAIDSIEVMDCENLVHVPTGAFWKFMSLNNLDIRNCPKLVAVDDQNNLLPSKLEYLYMENCGELDVPLLESSSGLTTLSHLTIQGSTNIRRIPTTENAFGSLCLLEIRGCSKLIELSLMQRAHNVEDQGSNVASLKIDQLFIDQLSLLLIEPLRSLRSVSDLSIDDCSGMDALPEQWLLQNNSTLKSLIIWNASTLRSLPATMARLTALEKLRIYKADLLVELPELPVSLKSRRITSSDDVEKF